MIVPDIKIMVRDDLPKDTIVVCAPGTFTFDATVDPNGFLVITGSWDPKKVSVLKNVG